MSAASLAPPRSASPVFSGVVSIGIAVAIVVLAVVARLLSGWETPFGFDETFSGVIASQTSIRALIGWCLNEIGGPVYYGLLWCWAQAFGTSVSALRAFSLVLSMATPLVILRWGHPDRSVRIYWAALLALWLPALEPATSARCYALLMLETAGQAIAFRRLIADPSRGRAFAWTGLSALSVLTHYHAAVLAGIQGLILLASRPRAVLRCWPALIVLLPVIGWMSVHFPLLARFATKGAWYPLLNWRDILLAPERFFDSSLIGNGVVLATVLGLTQTRYRLRDVDLADAAVALSGVATFGLLLAIGMLRPSFVWRYATMLGPAVLLGIAAGVQQAGKTVILLPGVVLALFAASTTGRIARQATSPIDDVRYNLNLGRPSQWLVAHHATRLGFLWDSPTGRISEASRMAEVIGFGPRQAGHPVAVTILSQPDDESPTTSVSRAIKLGEIDSLIWLADPTVPGTRARPDASTLRRYGWSCADFGGTHIVMLTCRAPFGDDTEILSG